jgi:hypothetical protein
MPTYVIVPDRDHLLEPFDSLSRRPLTQLCKVALLDAFWSDPGPLFDKKRMQVDIYFEYFEAQSMLALKNWGKYNISSLKFHHVTDVARMIKQECTRVEIESFLTEILTGECKSISSEVIDLTVRLLLMVPNWSILTGASADEATLTWMDGTVSKAFTRHFRQRNASKELMPIIPSDQGKIDKTLTVRNIEEIGGLKIVWTSNLLDHLQLRKDRRSVEIFHHASFLHYQAKRYVVSPAAVLIYG